MHLDLPNRHDVWTQLSPIPHNKANEYENVRRSIITLISLNYRGPIVYRTWT